MKRFFRLHFFSVILLVAFNACGQSFTLKDVNGNLVNNGDTITVNGTLTSSLTGRVDVMNISVGSRDVLVRRTNLNVVAGSGSAIVWVTSYPPTVSLTPIPQQILAGTTDSSFQGVYFANNFPGTSYIQFSFFDTSVIADSAWVVFEFNAVATSVEEHEVPELKIYPNPAGEHLTIEYNGNNESAFIICDAAGREVYSGLLIFGTHPLDVSQWKAGMYFLHLEQKSGKIFKIVKQ